MTRATARRASAVTALLALTMTTAIAVVATPTQAAPAATAAHSKKSASTSWFHDPVSSPARKKQVAVPKHPASGGKVRHTKASYRTAAGAIAVPATWAKGHQLAKRQAVVLNKSGLFGFDNAKPTKAAKKQVVRLGSSLKNVTSVRCEGYTDFGGSSSHERALSKQRAVSICKLVRSHTKAVKHTKTVGYGGARPVVVGGTQTRRAENRRVIIVVTKTKTKTKAAAPKPAAKAPSAPTLEEAQAGNGSAVLAFVAPASNGGSPITRYQVTTNSGTTWRPITTSGSHPIASVVDDLTNGDTYPVRVRAVNAVGPGPASNSLSVTPVAVPGAPVLTTAERGNASASIAFTAPTDVGGSAITGYEVSTNSGTTWTTLDTFGTGPITATLIGLTNGTTYPVVVRAVNAIGHSLSSNSLDVTPATVPGAPVPTGIVGGDEQAVLTFSAPSSNGGSAITGYQVSTNDGETWTTATTTGSGPLTVTVSGLGNGTTYAVKIRAVNSVGNGAASTASSVTPQAVPAAPVLASTTPGDASATFSFTAPTDNGGSVITGYQVSTNDGTSWTTFTPSGSSTLTGSLTGLTNGTTYPVTVRAFNAVGNGPASNSINVTPATVPGPPTLTAADPDDASAQLTFTAPSSDGGSAITGYDYSVDDGDTWAALDASAIFNSSSLAATLVDLTNGTTYPVLIRAKNAVGPGAPSDPLNVTPRTIPGAPNLVAANAGDGEAVLEFQAPASNGGAEITSYEASTDDGDTWVPLTLTNNGPLTATLAGLTNNVTYTVTVRAVNAAGPGSASNGVSVTPGLTQPGPPVLTVAEADYSAPDPGAYMDLEFTPPNVDGGSPITSYEYTFDDGDTWTPLDYSEGDPFTAQILIPNWSCNFLSITVSIRAVNAQGGSVESNSLLVEYFGC